MMRIEVDLPRERLELFFRLEADRMVNAVLRGWERSVSQCSSSFRPAALRRRPLQEALNGVATVAHPIGIHTGGHFRDHAYWNRASMLRLYDQHIVPNNATLTLVGDVTPDGVRTLAEKYFGRVPRRSPPAQMDVEVEPLPVERSGSTGWSRSIRRSSCATAFRGRACRSSRVRPRGPAAAQRTAAGQCVAEWIALDADVAGPRVAMRISRRSNTRHSRPSSACGAARSMRPHSRAKRELRFDWELQRTERGSLATQLGTFATSDEWRTLGAYMEARDRATAGDIQRVAQRHSCRRIS